MSQTTIGRPVLLVHTKGLMKIRFSLMKIDRSMPLFPSLQTSSSLERARARNIATWSLVSKLVAEPIYFDRALFQRRNQLAGYLSLFCSSFISARYQ